MDRRFRFVVSGAMLMATGLLGGVLLASASLAAAPVEDPAADTIDDTTQGPLAEARADIVSTSADYRADAITLTVRTRQANDPLGDANWASEYSFVEWVLDVTGDSRPDHSVQYYVKDGRHAGEIRPIDGDELACTPKSSGYDPTSGFTVQFEPKCVGSPASFSYQAALFYDTAAADENAPAASDMVPDRGFAGPVAVAGSAPGPAAPTPAAAAPAPATPPLDQKTRTAQGAPAPAPKPAPGGARTAPNAAAVSPGPAAGRDTAPGPQLARTGPSAAFVLIGAAFAFLLTGLGLVILGRGLAPAVRPAVEAGQIRPRR
jgi:hypothetical protein